MKKITVIYPKPPTEIIRLKKVAAYCRVSTQQETPRAPEPTATTAATTATTTTAQVTHSPQQMT